jgi:hypothetical protein
MNMRMNAVATNCRYFAPGGGRKIFFFPESGTTFADMEIHSAGTDAGLVVSQVHYPKLLNLPWVT